MDGSVLSQTRGATALDTLADIARRRDVRRLVYLHCDHFEPWRPVPGGASLDDNAVDVLRFAEISAANEASRKLTLFYKAHLGVTRRVGGPGVHAVSPADVFGFLDRTPTQEATFAEAMGGLLERVRHEVQVHIHHEYYTYNTSYKDPEIIEAFRSPDVLARDADRFELSLKLVLQAMRRETGQPFDRWFFVHGLWALNASDPSVCHITNEIDILMRHGCLGDFTFPAGRPNVDPILEVPHFVRPWDAPGAYMLPQAEPERAFGNAEAARSKFFLWSSQIRHIGSSLDYYSSHVARALEDTDRFAAQILEESVVDDGTLYFKTHSHSMHVNYFRDGRAAVFPHQLPAIRRLMGSVFDAANRAGADIDFLTASEVYDEFTRSRPPPLGGFALQAPSLLTAAGAAPALTPTGAKTPLLHAETINTVCCEVIAAALARDGPQVSGVGDYYQGRLRQKEVLMPYEVRLTRALMQEPGFESIYEIGCGIGALPFFLALNGMRAVGVERDPARVGLARAALGRLAESHPALPDMCEIQRGSAPGALRGVDGADSAAVFTNVTGTMAADDIEEIIAQMSGFRAVVVDLSRFFEIREKAAQSELLERFVQAGWGRPAPIASPVDPYWIFRREPATDTAND